MDFKCYIQSGWKPRIRAAAPKRAWMDNSPESYAYRCLPLNIANAHGWEILSPCGFEAEWNGGIGPDDVTITPDAGTPAHAAPVSIFGQGSFTFHIEGIFRTDPGVDLWASGPPNCAKDGLAPLNGVIATDWSPFTFTMNWRFTRPKHKIRFEENEPFCFIFPIQRSLLEACKPRIVPIGEDPQLEHQFNVWKASRDQFQIDMRTNPQSVPSKQWQKFYYLGTDAEGVPSPLPHRSKIRLPEFEGIKTLFPDGEFARLQKAHLASSTPNSMTAPDSPSGASALEDQLALRLQQLRQIADPLPRIRQYTRIEAIDFLNQHYAANVPMLFTGASQDLFQQVLHTPADTAVQSQSFESGQLLGLSCARQNLLRHQEKGSCRYLLVAPSQTGRLYASPCGHSRIRDLAHPDTPTQFPLVEGLQVQRIDLLAGQSLFVPMGWWVQAHTLEASQWVDRSDFIWPNAPLF